MHEFSSVLCFKCIITCNASETECVWWNALCDDNLCCSRQNRLPFFFFHVLCFLSSAAGTAKNERVKYRSYESITFFFFFFIALTIVTITHWRLALCASRVQSKLNSFPIAETSSRYNHNHKSIALHITECLTSIISVNISDIRWARPGTRNMQSTVFVHKQPNRIKCSSLFVVLRCVIAWNMNKK